MKKFTKICLILAVIVGCVGVSLCITALVLGVTMEDVAGTGIVWDGQAGKIVVNQGERQHYEQSFEDVEGLEVEVSAGNVMIEETDADLVTVTGDQVSPGFSCSMEGKTLKIEDENNRFFSLGSMGSSGHDSTVTVQIPRGTVLKKMDLDITMGELVVSGFRTKKLVTECGTGSAQLEGDVLGKSEISCDLGEVSYTGNLGGDTRIECGMGSATLDLTNRQQEFDYDLECGMGSIRAGDISIDGIAGEKKISNGADRTMEVECGMGDVEILFEE